MSSLKDRALAAFKQRDEMEEAKRLLRLKAKVQEVTGVTVEPTENLVEADGLWFRMNVGWGVNSNKEFLSVCDDPERGDHRWQPANTLADIGEAIDLWYAIDNDPGDPEEEVAA